MIPKSSSNNIFLNQMDLINTELFGDLLNNPLVIISFILILNILLIYFVWEGIQCSKYKMCYGDSLLGISDYH